MTKKFASKGLFSLLINIFTWLTLLLALIISACTILASFTDDDTGKEIFGAKLMIVNSDSMSKSELSQEEEIFFNSGDLIIVKSVEDVSQLNVGDVITFISNNPDSFGKTITHKILEIKYSPENTILGFVTYGINTGAIDKVLVTPENVVGVYQGKLPNVGHLFNFLKTSRGYFLSILFPCVLLIIFFSLKVGRLYEQRRSISVSTDELEALKSRVAKLEELVFKNQDVNEDVILLETNNNSNITEPKSFATGNRKKVSFAEKLLGLEETKKDYFNELHNQLVSYKKISSRISFKCISYRFGRKTVAKMTVRGKTLKLHLALKIDDFDKNVYFQQNLQDVKAYADVPFTVKVKSNRGKNNSLKLIDALANNLQLVKKQNFANCDAIQELTYNLAKETPITQEVAITTLLAVPTSSIGKRKKVSFAEKLLNLEDIKKDYFNELHNQLVSYKKISSRISFKCISYRFGRKTVAKMTVRGKTLKLHLALNFEDFDKNVYFQQNLQDVKAYADVPFTVKVKSNRGKNNSLKLIDALANNLQLVKKQNFTMCDTTSQLLEYTTKNTPANETSRKD